MAEIKISGKKVLRTIHKDFQEQFPYLILKFYTPEEWKKSQQGVSIYPLPGDKRLAEVRTVPPPKDENEISIHGRTLIKNLEENFLKTYGLHVQVCYHKIGNTNYYYTSGDADSMSLTQFNKKLEDEGGYTKKPPYEGLPK
jgi:hypothetical protein